MNFSVKLSQLLGLGDIVNGIVGGLGETIQNLVNGYLSVFANQLYLIFLAFAKMLDVIQLLFKKLAGLDTYMLDNTGQVQSGDVALALINSPQIKNVFYSMVILGIVLLFISTFVAVLKSEYQPLDAKGSTNKGKIIAKSLRSIITMATVPVVTVLGLMMASALLNSIDLATSGGQSSMLSGRLFAAAAYDANRARKGASAYSQAFEDALKTHNNFDIFIEGSGSYISETVADKIDAAFRNGTAVLNESAAYNFRLGIDGATHFVFNYMGEPNYPTSFEIHNFRLVWYYYNLNFFNYFVGIGAAIMLTVILLNVLLGLIKRIYALVLLFVIAPPIIAISPMYEDAFKGWKKEFIKSALSIFAVVVTMNIYIMLIPVLGNIDFFYVPEGSLSGPAEAAANVALEGLNFLAQLLILIGGAVFFKDFSKTIAGMIGSEDALDVGAGKSKDFVQKAAKAAAIASGAGALVAGNPLKMLSSGTKSMGASYKKAREGGASKWAAVSESLAGGALGALKGGKGGLAEGVQSAFSKKDEEGNDISGFRAMLKAPKRAWKAATGSSLAGELGVNSLWPQSEAKKKQADKIKDKKKEDDAKALDQKRHDQMIETIINKDEILQQRNDKKEFESTVDTARDTGVKAMDSKINSNDNDINSLKSQAKDYTVKINAAIKIGDSDKEDKYRTEYENAVKRINELKAENDKALEERNKIISGAELAKKHYETTKQNLTKTIEDAKKADTQMDATLKEFMERAEKVLKDMKK